MAWNGMQSNSYLSQPRGKNEQKGYYRVRVRWNPNSLLSRPTAVAGWQWQSAGSPAVWRTRRAVSAQDMGPQHCQTGIFRSRTYCGGRSAVPAAGRAGNRQATGLLFHSCSAMSETVVPGSQEYFGVLAAHSENPPVPSGKSTFALTDENWWVCTIALFFSNVDVTISFLPQILQYLLTAHGTQGEHRSGVMWMQWGSCFWASHLLSPIIYSYASPPTPTFPTVWASGPTTPGLAPCESPYG